MGHGIRVTDGGVVRCFRLSDGVAVLIPSAIRKELALLAGDSFIVTVTSTGGVLFQPVRVVIDGTRRPR